MHKLPLEKVTLSMMYVNIKSCLMDHILIRTTMGLTLAETLLWMHGHSHTIYVPGWFDVPVGCSTHICPLSWKPGRQTHLDPFTQTLLLGQTVARQPSISSSQVGPV